MIQSHKDLHVWQEAMLLVEDVYKAAALLPKYEQYGLSDQMRRSAVSVPSNIAEGYQRNNRAEYRQFIGISKGSAAELETQLLIAQKTYSLDLEQVLDRLLGVQKMLTKLSIALKS